MYRLLSSCIHPYLLVSDDVLSSFSTSTVSIAEITLINIHTAQYCMVLIGTMLYLTLHFSSHPPLYVVYSIDCFCSACYIAVLACLDQYQYIYWVHSILSQSFGQHTFNFSHTLCYHTVLHYAHLYCLEVYLGAQSVANNYKCILQCQYVPIILLACLN